MPDSLDPVVTETLRSWRVQLEAGISSAEALELCAGMLRGMASNCFHRASQRTANGEGIVATLDALSPILTAGERAILAAGWSAGRIEPTIDSLVKQRELWRDARRRILSKLIIPIVTLIIASFIAPLPGLIAGLMTTGELNVVEYFIFAILPIAIAGGLALAAMLFFNARANARVFNADGTPVPASNADRLMLLAPLVGMIERKRSLAEFGDLLSNLLGAGAPIVQALDTTARAVRNGCYRKEVVRLSKAAAQGQSFASALLEGPERLWPAEFCAAVRVGEQSGNLDATLARLAKGARESYVRAIETLAEWLPKLIYGVIALFVIWNIFKLFFLVYMKPLQDILKEQGV